MADYYLPGYQAGGPIRTIANMRRLLAGEVEIEVLTRDRDLGAQQSYEGVAVDEWNAAEDGSVYYASPRTFGVAAANHAIAGRRFDLIYLNSFFSLRGSIRIYHWIRRRRPDLPVLLAPRGELSEGALSIKAGRKAAYLRLARLLGLYKGVLWHASTADEEAAIRRQFPSAIIELAEDPVSLDSVGAHSGRPPSPAGCLRLAFISRISPMKNLHGLLDLLCSMTSRVELDIYGPISDPSYWKECQGVTGRVPANISVSYRGSLPPEQVSATFADYDCFALPSFGENFGHVVFEALRAGTPVVVSDQTPWKPDERGAVSVLPLSDPGAWCAALDSIAGRATHDKAALRKAARDYAEAYARGQDATLRNRMLFLKAAGVAT